MRFKVYLILYSLHFNTLRMNNNFTKFIFLVSLCITSLIFSQKRTEDFNLRISENEKINSPYKTIKLIDVRPDTTNIGIIQKGAFNSKVKVVPSTPLKIQFQELLNNLNKNESANDELVLYLKQFYFAEVTGALSEKGYCYFQAFLFSKKSENEYLFLNKIDSVIVHSSLDVTKATMKKGSDLVSNFMIRNMYHKPTSGEILSLDDVLNYDKIIKKQYPLYSQNQLTDGLYKDYESFRDQKPSDIIPINIKTNPSGERVQRVFTSKNGKEKEIYDKSDYYALVYQGVPYIYTNIENTMSKLRKDEKTKDFYFLAKAKTTAKTGNIVTASIFFGIIGGLIASDANAVFEMKIDYLNGSFIPIKEISKK